MRKQAYYETVRSGLIPVRNLRKTDDPALYKAEVMKTTFGYKEGETITSHRWHFVYKAGIKGPYQMVTEVQL